MKQIVVLEQQRVCYYPFGLTMAGISSKALNFGNPVNKKKYNSYELNSNFDINLYESFYRSHDPQIGRFLQLDPKPNEAFSLYSAMDNNPIRYADVLGDTVIFMIDKEAADGHGHMSMYFQNDKGEWFFYSQGATNPSGYLASGSNTSGGVDLFQVQITETRVKTDEEGNVIKDKEGTPITEEVKRNPTQDELKEIAKNGIGSYKFDDFSTLNTTKEQDKTITANAFESKSRHESGKAKYNLYSNNCVDACQNVINKNTGIRLPGDFWPGPNHYFNTQLKEGVNWLNLPPAEKQRQIDEMVKKQRAEMAREPKF